MGGLLFAARNVSRIGINRGAQDLKEGVSFSVSINNPYPAALSGKAAWVLDASAFSVEPESVSLRIPPGGKQQYTFRLKSLKDDITLLSLPRLQFHVAAGGYHYRFHREVRLLENLSAPYQPAKPVLDGQLADWEGIPVLKLGQEPTLGGELRTCYDAAMLYVAVTVPTVKAEEEEELGFKDDLQIGMARRVSDTDFGPDFLRLGFSSAARQAGNRTAGRKTEGMVAGVRCFSRAQGGSTCYEIAVPLRLLQGLKPDAANRLVLDLSFPLPDGGVNTPEPADPNPNTFAYRVRYGNDSLVPVHFVELNLQRRKP